MRLLQGNIDADHDEGRAHFMEKRGEGVPIILDNSAALAGREPDYRVLDDAELMLTIHAARTDQADDRA